MSDANNTRFTVVNAPVFGTQVVNPAWLVMNTLGAELTPTNQVVESKTIRSNRNPPGTKIVSPASGGRIPFELQYDVTGALWQLLSASIQADSETAATTEFTTATASSGPNGLNGTNLHVGLEVGDIIRVRTSSNVLVGYYYVLSITIGSPDFIEVAGGPTPVGSSLKVLRGKRIKNGSTQKQFDMLDSNFAPGTSSFNRFELMLSSIVDGFKLTIAKGQISTGEFQIVGRGSSGLTTSDPSSGTPTYTAAPLTEVHDSMNNVPSVNVAYTSGGLGSYLSQSIEFSWTNGSAARSNVGSRLATSIRSGTFRGTGQHNSYYDDIAEYNKALLGTSSAIYVVSQDSAGNAMAFSVPSIKYGNPTRTGKSQDNDIIANLPFSFETSATESIGIRILGFAA
jgi:hypothetical protein